MITQGIKEHLYNVTLKEMMFRFVTINGAETCDTSLTPPPRLMSAPLTGKTNRKPKNISHTRSFDCNPENIYSVHV